jgi:O-antigen ligase
MLFIFAFILSIPYNILLNEPPNIGLKQNIIKFKNWIEPFIIFFIMFNILDDKKTCKKALFGLGILLLITALAGPLTLLNIFNIGRATAAGRAAGFGDTNEFAAFLVLFIPLMLTFALFHKNNTFRTSGAVVLLVTLFALIFSASRGGILSFVVSMFGYLFVLYIQKLIRLRTLFSITIIVLMVGTITFILAPHRVKRMVSNRLDPTKSESVEDFSAGRIRIWSNCIKLFAENPIFGHGAETTRTLMDMRFGLEKPAHNDYLEYLVEHGIIGCTVFILIFLNIAHIIWNYQKTTPDPWEKKLYIGYMAGLIGYTFAMIFVGVSTPRPIFWFYTAVFMRYGQLQKIVNNNESAFAIVKKDTAV